MMAEGDLLFPGFLDRDRDQTLHDQNPFAGLYAMRPKYDAATALRQGTLFPWLDDHWRRRTENSRRISHSPGADEG